jgi:phosphoenolpyruvate carboxykinase (ATP)
MTSMVGTNDKGFFNFEGGCSAKIIYLSKEAEPEVYETTRRFGTVLENVAIDTQTRRVDQTDDSFTEKYPCLLPADPHPQYRQ